MTPFYLVTGFLGGGKTTLLKNILSAYADKKRIAIIQNEFAPTGTDGKELQMTKMDFKLIEINNGSVFCICMLGNFVSSLSRLVDSYQPELIFLEASGLSDPINIIELLQSPEIKNKVTLAHIFTVVDAVYFSRSIAAYQRVKHQIMIADTVIINKTDKSHENIEAISQRARSLNPYAGIVISTYCNVIVKNYIDKITPVHAAAEAHQGKVSEGRPDMGICVLRMHHKISMEGLKMFIFELQNRSPRMKGYVNMMDGDVTAIQAVYNDVQFKKISGYTGPTELIIFGKDVTVRQIRELYKKHAVA